MAGRGPRVAKADRGIDFRVNAPTVEVAVYAVGADDLS